jgi:hypothetical protein
MALEGSITPKDRSLEFQISYGEALPWWFFLTGAQYDDLGEISQKVSIHSPEGPIIVLHCTEFMKGCHNTRFC